MTMQYKLEFLKNEEVEQDPSVYIHLRSTPPVYMHQTDKETYQNDNNPDRHPWMDGIFNVGGVVEASSLAYRVWVSKSPVYSWDEVIPPLLTFMASQLGEGDPEEMLGSGVTLDSVLQRRPI
jgi:hypothetical protein